MDNRLFTQLEKIAYRLQKNKMHPRKTTEAVNLHYAFFHPQDKSEQIIAFHQIRLNKALGKKIILVTGCFDILHREHKNLLRKAKKHGDFLIVGLESDTRIKELKGTDRPLNPWLKRAKNLFRLKEVNLIIKLPDFFANPAVRLAFLRLIKPDVLAISSQDPLEKQKKKDCRKIGCQLKIVHQYNPEISTTQILLDKKD